MTEQEIVEYLKNNRTKGVAFGFMPEEVKEWCSKNDSNLVYYSVNGTWFSGDNRSIFDMNEIVALPDSFQIKQEPQSGWVEFEIKSGVFDYDDRCFDWWDWGCFLNYCKGCNTDNFTDFGGWQYEGFLSWYMQPMLCGKGNKKELRNYEDNHEESTPAIPVKIRFWRKAD